MITHEILNKLISIENALEGLSGGHYDDYDLDYIADHENEYIETLQAHMKYLPNGCNHFYFCRVNNGRLEIRPDYRKAFGLKELPLFKKQEMLFSDIIYELNAYASDNYECGGLPTHDEHMDKMVIIIEETIRKHIDKYGKILNHE